MFIPLMMLTMESSGVVALRMMKLMSGDSDTLREAHLMVSEKIDAAFEATSSLMAGASSDEIVIVIGSMSPQMRGGWAIGGRYRRPQQSASWIAGPMVRERLLPLTKLATGHRNETYSAAFSKRPPR